MFVNSATLNSNWERKVKIRVITIRIILQEFLVLFFQKLLNLVSNVRMLDFLLIVDDFFDSLDRFLHQVTAHIG